MKTAKAYLNSGKNLRKQGQLNQAIEQYKKALQIRPSFTPALAQLAEVYEKQKDIDSAISCLEKLVALESNNRKFIHLLSLYSQSFIKENDVTKIVSTYQRLLEVVNNTQAEILHRKLGQVLYKVSIRLGKFDQAIIFFKKAIENQPDNPWLHYNLGLNLARENQLNDAINSHQEAIRINPRFWQALMELGILFQKIGNHEQAFQYRINALQINPNLSVKQLKYFKPSFPEEQALLKETLIKSLQEMPDIDSGQYPKIGYILGREGEFSEATFYYQQSIYHELRKSKPKFIAQYWEDAKLQEPNFLMIGVAKCGTTSLYDYISQHPQTLPAIRKEPSYLNTLLPKLKRVEQQRDWSLLNEEKSYYFAHFSPRPEGSSFITGEASTINILPGIEKIVYNWFPKVKLIIIFRNPIKRFISHYNQILKSNNPKHSFEKTIRSELELLEKVKSSTEIHQIIKRRQQMMLRPGLYVYIIERWMKLFPKEQFLILTNEDLTQNPSGVMKQVFNFLGLPEYDGIDYTPRNVGNYPKDIDPDLLSRLQDFYRPHNQRLEEFLGRKFNWD